MIPYHLDTTGRVVKGCVGSLSGCTPMHRLMLDFSGLFNTAVVQSYPRRMTTTSTRISKAGDKREEYNHRKIPAPFQGVFGVVTKRELRKWIWDQNK